MVEKFEFGPNRRCIGNVLRDSTNQ